jgi:hypothetical protein
VAYEAEDGQLTNNRVTMAIGAIKADILRPSLSVSAASSASGRRMSPDVRASHPALWIDISEVQRELNRNLRRVKIVPQGFERGHPCGEPGRRIGSRLRFGLKDPG